MESSKRSLFCVMAKVLGFYTAMFSLFLLVGGYLDLVLWKLVFFNWGQGHINPGCASTMAGISPNLLEGYRLESSRSMSVGKQKAGEH